MRYDPAKIEKKWQEWWQKEGVYEPDLKRAKPRNTTSAISSRRAAGGTAEVDIRGKRPFYNLMMFPYPSAEGLHVGNMYAFVGADIYGRFKRMQGHDVFEPMGLDGFGIHSENYAIKIGKHPVEQAKISERNFYRQLEMIGNGFAWREKMETYDPEYYKWTQWIFVQMFKRGLAYRKKASVNWCPSCKTVLADEQVITGKCERCGTIVVKKELEQWFFKITNYAERLLKNLGKIDPVRSRTSEMSADPLADRTSNGIDWSAKIKIAQKNWIGKSEGAEISFPLSIKNNFVLLHGYTGTPEGVFFPWLKKELGKRSLKFYAPQLPNPNQPKEPEQVGFVLKNSKFDGNTVLFGHSLGAVVAMKVLEKLDKPIAGLVLAGGFLDTKFRDHPRPFDKTFVWQFDFEKIRKNVGFVTILSDPNDYAIPIEQGKTLAQKLKGKLVELSGEKEHFTAKEEPLILESLLPSIKIFTTRPDTLFGTTYMVVAPEHPLIKNQESRIKNKEEFNEYVKKAKAKSEEDRIAEGREKTGVELKGIKAINPVNGEEIPVWVADYVFGNVGTGAIMAVPAHDDRDKEFTLKYGLSIKQVVAPYSVVTGTDAPRREKDIFQFDAATSIIKHRNENNLFYVVAFTDTHHGLVGGHVEPGENLEQTALRKVKEESGYMDIKDITPLFERAYSRGYKTRKQREELCRDSIYVVKLRSGKRVDITDHETKKGSWMTAEEILRLDSFVSNHKLYFEHFIHNKSYTMPGKLVNSGKFDGMDSEKAKWEITKFVGGERKTQYRLRDWLISRQRYWGPPIPMIYCEKCAWQPVPEKDLPVKLPYIKDFRPTGTDKSPLASVEKFYKVRCPRCKSWARRETDVSDTFLDSAWYYLRYPSIRDKKHPWDPAITKKWLPVNMYIGGAEHAVLHLLYVRFLAMVFSDSGMLHFEEPFKKFRAHGLLIKDGAKMSKSRGNVINPDEYIHAYGADALRMYLMFLGPFEQGGDFRDSGIAGITRFLNRVWNLGSHKLQITNDKQIPKLQKILHKTIKKVTEDIENLQYNTAISALMVLLNEFEANTASVSAEDVKVFLKLLAPFAPHITEELYSTFDIRHSSSHSVHLESWPKCNPKFIREETFELIIQVNGKVRGKVTLPVGTSEAEAKKAALGLEGVRKFVPGDPKKIIVVPDKLINFVV